MLRFAFIALWLGLSLNFLYYCLELQLPAEASEVRALIESTEEVPAAREHVAAKLRATPEPTRIELSNMRDSVNGLLVQAEVSKATASMPERAHARAGAESSVDPWIEMRPLFWALFAVLILGGPAYMVLGSRR